MAKSTWTFTSPKGQVISTENPTDAEKYRHTPGFTENGEKTSTPQHDTRVDLDEQKQKEPRHGDSARLSKKSTPAPSQNQD